MGFFVGFDGGLTKTALALCTRDGRLLARVRGPGCAIVGLPTDAFFNVASPLLQELYALAGTRTEAVERIVIGLSGVDFADEIGVQHGAIAAGLALEPGCLTLVNDGVAALWGASMAARLTIVQHGSGVTMAFRTEHAHSHVFDSLDIGAMYDLRREAVARVARMIDGRSARSDLAPRVLDHAGVRADQFADWAFRHPDLRSHIAGLAPVVFDAWQDGDRAASELVHRAAEDYVLATGAMGAHVAPLGESFSAAFGGGVIAQGGLPFQRLLATKLAGNCPHAQWVPVAMPPEAGALILAAEAAGLDPHARFTRLQQDWDAT